MPTVLQLRRGTTAEHSSFTGAEGEVTVNTTKDTLVVHDGSTQGGFEVALADGTNFGGDTDDVSEGSTNLYYTDARVGSYLTGGTSAASLTTLTTSSNGTVGGNLTVTGNFTVNGTTTTINSTTLTVDDKEIVLASGAADSAAADGAGISVDGAGASILYDHTGTQWEINKPIEVTGAILPAANVTYDLGSSGLRWRDLYLSGSTLDLGGSTISVSGGAFEMTSLNVTSTLTLDSVGLTAVQTSAEAFADNDTSVMTSAAANDRFRIDIYDSTGSLLN